MYAEPIQYVRLFDNYFNIFLTFTIALLTGPCCTIIFYLILLFILLVEAVYLRVFIFIVRATLIFYLTLVKILPNECDMEHISITCHFSFESPLSEKCMKIQWKFMFKE